MKSAVRYLVLAILVLVSMQSFAQIAISVNFGPPALPVYEQPPCPEEGYIWTPGYWDYDPDYGYYWVPGTWVLAPEPGYLWTPGWWGYDGGNYLFHRGYWGTHVGFYGGINYGFGYTGDGFEGGRWDHDHYYYNRAVNNINVTNIHNTYNTTVVNNVTVNRVSYNGGNGGITARPTPQQEAVAQERHIAPVAAQVEHVQTARTNPQLRAATNQGRPPIAATERPAAFTGNHVMPAKEAGAPYHPPANHTQPQPANEAGRQPENMRPATPNATPNMAPNNAAPRPGNPSHASELQPHQAPAPVNTGNTQRDQKYQQQQQQMVAKQNQQHQQLQMKQQQEHDRATQQNMNAGRQQQMEQHHQQQTQQMEQRHTDQSQHLQQRQAGPGGGRPH